MKARRLAIPFVLALAACSVRAGNPGGGGGGARIDKRFPAGATSGTRVILDGRNFGAVKGNVRFGKQEAEVEAWSNGKIVVVTPMTTATSCEPLRVETGDGDESNPMPFSYGEHGVWVPWSEVPAARSGHVAVWTGTEMIVWGGPSNTGGRYNPATDSWMPTATVGAPGAGQGKQTAVWTGTEMIVWGLAGTRDNFFGDNKMAGGRYDPASDAWKKLSLEQAPHNGAGHSAVWTGSRLVTWGGEWSPSYAAGTATGGEYDPTTNTWRLTDRGATAPGRFTAFHTAVWSGDEVLYYGGADCGSPEGGWGCSSQGGFAYAPPARRWRSLAMEGAPVPRWHHVAAWVGARMLVWGGSTPLASDTSGNPNSGGVYDPANDAWHPMSESGAPAGRMDAQAAWSGTELIVWGGRAFNSGWSFLTTNTGGRYDPEADRWRTLPTQGAPAPRSAAASVWTGTELLIFGGTTGDHDLRSGGRYAPQQDRWAPMQSVGGEPTERHGYFSAWSGTELFVWGGEDASRRPSNRLAGGRYVAATNAWLPIATEGQPTAGATVWTGKELITTGGYDFDNNRMLKTGARYRPESDSWAPMSGMPTKRFGHKAVWTGKQMLVWGGTYDGYTLSPTGLRYDPLTDDWSPITDTGAPAARILHTATWTGKAMLVYGGTYRADFVAALPQLVSGARYLPDEDRWVALPDGPLDVEAYESALWTGTKLLVTARPLASGSAQSGRVPMLAEYDEPSNAWRMVDLPADFKMSNMPALAWTGKEAIIYSGVVDGVGKLTGYAYDPEARTMRALHPGCGVFQTPPVSNTDDDDFYTAVWTGDRLLTWGPGGGLTYLP